MGECVLRGRITQFAALIAVIVIIVVIPSELVVAEIKIQLVLFVLSVGAALVGIHLGLDARKILIVRHNAINRYERPHVIQALEILFNDMALTKTIVKKNNGGANTGGLRGIVYTRIDRHVDVQRQVASRFLEIGLARLHQRLDPAFKPLSELNLLDSASAENVVGRLNDAMGAVVQAIKDIKNAPPV